MTAAKSRRRRSVLGALFRLISWLPLRAVHVLGALAGWLTYALSPTYRRRLRANLRQAGFDDARLRRAAVAEAGKQALETAWVWMRPAAHLLRVIDVAHAEVEQQALADGRPVIYLTPHLGCFEITAQYYVLQHADHDRPMTALYRVPRVAALRPLMESARARHGLQLAPADVRGVRRLMRALKSRQVIGILPDQVPAEGEGVWAPFFGRPAFTMTLPGRLAAAADALLIFIYAERLPRGAGFRISFERLSGALTGDAQHDATLINRDLERLIRRLPTQYLWGYNRYKTPSGVTPPERSE